MAGRGPAPKPTGRRVRRNSSEPMQVIRFEHAAQPDLPDDVPWPDATIRWWAMWASSPLSDNFGTTDWDFLLDTALIHAQYWSGDLSMEGPLRLRVAKFGATPEDRARLKIQFAEADAAESRRGNADRPNARERYGSVTRIHAVNE